VVLWTRETSLMRELPDEFTSGRVLHYPALLAAGLLQWLKLAVLAAFVLLVASFAQSQLYTVIAGFFVLVICHLQYLAQEAYAHSGSAMARVVGGLIGVLFPNFQLFNVADALGAGGALPWGRVVRVACYALVYIAVAGALSVLSFRKREI